MLNLHLNKVNQTYTHAYSHAYSEKFAGMRTTIHSPWRIRNIQLIRLRTPILILSKKSKQRHK